MLFWTYKEDNQYNHFILKNSGKVFFWVGFLVIAGVIYILDPFGIQNADIIDRILLPVILSLVCLIFIVFLLSGQILRFGFSATWRGRKTIESGGMKAWFAPSEFKISFEKPSTFSPLPNIVSSRTNNTRKSLSSTLLFRCEEDDSYWHFTLRNGAKLFIPVSAFVLLAVFSWALAVNASDQFMMFLTVFMWVCVIGVMIEARQFANLEYRNQFNGKKLIYSGASALFSRCDYTITIEK